MKNFFLTGTGTGVGKTLLTCALTCQLRGAGRRARAIKPVISGFEIENIGASDTGLLLAAQGLPVTWQHVESISPWRFAAPFSPDMAAEDEGRTIDFSELAAFCKQQDDVDYLLVEGAGGAMTPLDDTHTVLDWAAALGFPVILVAGSYLGALSHTLAAARALLSAGLTLHAVVVSESESQPVPLTRTLRTLQKFLPPTTRLHAIARLDSSDEVWKTVPDLTRALIHE